MSVSNRLALPFIDAAQSQKHVTHNEALVELDALVQLSVKTRNVATPPAAPAESDRYLVGAGATGAFAGKANAIAAFDNGGWAFLSPRAGWRTYVEAENLLLLFDGTNWTDLGLALHALQNLSLLGLGATADASNPLSAKLNAALFAAKAPGEGGTGDMRFTLNKSASANTVSQLYQTNWSGRAETGLAGDDHFHIKVSADGAAWKEAINIDPATGFAGFGVAAPKAVLHGFTSAAGQIGIRFTGTGYTGGADATNGPVFMAAYNAPGNHQMFIGESETGSGARVIGTTIDGFNYQTNTRLNLGLGTDTTTVMSYGDLLGLKSISAITTIASGSYTVAALPAGGVGKRAFVTDASAPVFGASVVGGGTIGVPVYYANGAWKVG